MTMVPLQMQKRFPLTSKCWSQQRELLLTAHLLAAAVCRCDIAGIWLQSLGSLGSGSSISGGLSGTGTEGLYM